MEDNIYSTGGGQNQPLEDWAYVTKWLINSIEWLLLCIVGPSWLCGVDLEICKTADGMIAT